jgi:hypothetical protein
VAHELELRDITKAEEAKIAEEVKKAKAAKRAEKAKDSAAVILSQPLADEAAIVEVSPTEEAILRLVDTSRASETAFAVSEADAVNHPQIQSVFELTEVGDKFKLIHVLPPITEILGYRLFCSPLQMNP